MADKRTEAKVVSLLILMAGAAGDAQDRVSHLATIQGLINHGGAKP